MKAEGLTKALDVLKSLPETSKHKGLTYVGAGGNQRKISSNGKANGRKWSVAFYDGEQRVYDPEDLEFLDRASRMRTQPRVE